MTLFTSVAGPGSTTSTYTFVNDLYGFRVVPTNSSLGHGVFTLNYSGLSKSISYTLTYERVIPLAAHIHSGMPNENGPVVFDLGKPTNIPFEGTLALTEAQLSDLVNGKMYVDIHTAIFPDGEIRAQIGKER